MKKPIVIPDHIKELISGHLSDSLNPDELSVLKAWIDESPTHKKYFNEMRGTWVLTGKDMHSGKDKEKKLLEIVDKVSRDNRKINRGFWTWQRIAASWVIIIFGAGALGWYLNESDSAKKPAMSVAATTTVQAKMGSQSMIDMPDGSRVWLNGGSKLIYDNSYGEQNREVFLTGEGCFEIATNPEKPFVVKAGGLSIKAYGTTFNVKAYPEDKAVTTTLVKGKVTIEGKDENNKLFSLEMKPNENVTYLTEHVAKKEEELQVKPSQTVNLNNIPEPVVIESNVKPELYTSWKDDLWVIEKQKLGTLSKDFERRYDVYIKFVSEDAMNYHFSGTIQSETIEQVMTILRRTVPLKYSFDKNVITISEDKQLVKEFQLKNK